MLSGIPELLRRAFSFYENLFPKEAEDEEGIIEDENGNKLDTNTNKKKPSRANLRLAVQVRVLTYVVLMLPSMGGVGYFFIKNRELEVKIATLNKQCVATEKKLVEVQKAAGEAEQDGIERAYVMLSCEEVKGLIMVFSTVKAEIENSPYWPSRDQTLQGRKQAMKDISSQLVNIRRHLEEVTKFNHWLDALLPKDLHSSILEALDTFRDRCIPQMESASDQTDLTALKAEVIRSLRDLIDSLKDANDGKRAVPPFVKK